MGMRAACGLHHSYCLLAWLCMCVRARVRMAAKEQTGKCIVVLFEAEVSVFESEFLHQLRLM